MSFEVKPATRAGVKPLIGVYGKSGSGKTMSALLLARGIAGPKGRIVLCDSENRRGSIFADLIPGGYNVLDLDEPFTPERYSGAIKEAEAAADVVVVDSFSHEWYGPGGVLEMQEAELQRMAGDDYKRREQCKMSSWIRPKMEHKGMVNRLLRCKLPLIVCLRGEEKTHIDKKEGEKARVITDPFSTPIADPRFIFELLLNFETVAKTNPKSQKVEGGFVIPRKVTHPGLLPLLPDEHTQIGIAHGEAIARWCEGQSLSKKPEDARAPLLSELRRVSQAVHQWDGKRESWPAAKAVLQRWLADECGIDVALDSLTVEELTEAISRAKNKAPQGQLV